MVMPLPLSVRLPNNELYEISFFFPQESHAGENEMWKPGVTEKRIFFSQGEIHSFDNLSEYFTVEISAKTTTP